MMSKYLNVVLYCIVLYLNLNLYTNRSENICWCVCVCQTLMYIYFTLFVNMIQLRGIMLNICI